VLLIEVTILRLPAARQAGSKDPVRRMVVDAVYKTAGHRAVRVGMAETMRVGDCLGS